MMKIEKSTVKDIRGISCVTFPMDRESFLRELEIEISRTKDDMLRAFDKLTRDGFIEFPDYQPRTRVRGVLFDMPTEP